MARRIPNSAIPRPSTPLTRNRRNYGKKPPNNVSLPEQSSSQTYPKPSPKVPDRKSPLPLIPITKHEPTLPPAPSVTVDSILAGKLSEETKRAYRSDLKHFLKFLGYPDQIRNPDELITVLCKVDRNMAAAYRDHLLEVENMAAATVNRHLATANTIYAALLEEGIINRNPFSWVKRPKVSNVGKTAALTQEQAEAILAQPDLLTPMGQRDRILLLLMFFCGLRRSEVRKVAREDFFETQGHLMLWVHGKGRSDKSESVMIPDQIQYEIRDYIADKAGPLFIPTFRNNNTGKPISANRVFLLFKKYCQLAGIDPKGFSPHSTRATFITLTLKGGASIQSVMYASRHANPSTTIRYNSERLNVENHASKHLHIKVDNSEVSADIKSSSLLDHK